MVLVIPREVRGVRSTFSVSVPNCGMRFLSLFSFRKELQLPSMCVVILNGRGSG